MTVTVVSDPGEEAAELIGYNTLDTLLGQAAASVKNAQAQVAALRAAQGGDAAIEERVEDALTDALQAHVTQALGTLGAVYALACDMDDDDEDDGATGLYGPSGPLGMAFAKALADVERVRLKFATETKKGRVLSRANETMLKTSQAHCQASMDHVQAVLDSVASGKPDDGSDNEPNQNEKPGDDEEDAILVAYRAEDEDDVITLDFDDDPGDDLILVSVAESDTVRVDEAEMRAVIADIFAPLKTIVAQETRAAIDGLRGRVRY